MTELDPISSPGAGHLETDPDSPVPGTVETLDGGPGVGVQEPGAVDADGAPIPPVADADGALSLAERVRALGVVVAPTYQDWEILDLMADLLGLHDEATDEEVLAAIEAEESAGDVPAGKITDVLDWVGRSVLRAQRALAEEEASKAPRVTLLAELGAIAHSSDIDTAPEPAAARPAHDPFRGYPAR